MQGRPLEQKNPQEDNNSNITWDRLKPLSERPKKSHTFFGIKDRLEERPAPSSEDEELHQWAVLNHLYRKCYTVIATIPTINREGRSHILEIKEALKILDVDLDEPFMHANAAFISGLNMDEEAKTLEKMVKEAEDAADKIPGGVNNEVTIFKSLYHILDRHVKNLELTNNILKPLVEAQQKLLPQDQLFKLINKIAQQKQCTNKDISRLHQFSDAWYQEINKLLKVAESLYKGNDQMRTASNLLKAQMLEAKMVLKTLTPKTELPIFLPNILTVYAHIECYLTPIKHDVIEREEKMAEKQTLAPRRELKPQQRTDMFNTGLTLFASQDAAAVPSPSRAQAEPVPPSAPTLTIT